MMQIERLVIGALNTNVYLLVFDKDIFVIDPAAEPEAILAAAKKYNKSISHILLTHGHFDHCNAAAALQFGGAKVLMSKMDYDMIKSGYDLARYMGVHFNGFEPDGFLSEGEVILNGQAVRIIETPGHTAGSLTFVIDQVIFSGDTLFNLGVGRTDLPTGNGRKLIQSVKKLYELDDATVYPGHGGSTTLNFEKENNPYVKA